MEQTKKFNYKWVVVGTCFLMIFTCLGFCSSVRPLVLAPITEALGIKRSVYAITDTLRYITTSVINLFFGALIARFGAKRLISAGFLCLISSALCYAFAPNIFVIYGAGIFLGLGLSWTTTTMVGFVINKWCKRNKGTIMGAVLAANGLGGATSAQILTPIIEQGTYGYRNAYFVIACILFVVGTLVVIFLRENPREGEVELPDPNAPQKKRRGQSWSGVEQAVVMKKGYTYLALLCIFLAGLTLNGITGISAAHMRDTGIDPALVATIVSCHSIALTGFKFLTGYMYDRFGLRVTVSISTVTGIAVMVALSMITATPAGIVLAFFYGVFSSLALPLETVMLPIFANDLFGERSYNKMLGIIVSVNTVGYAVGALFMNTCYDLLGTYKAGLLVCAGIMLFIACAIQLAIGLAHKERRAVQEREQMAQNAE